MSALDRRGRAEPRQQFSSVFFMQEEGGALLLPARACANLLLPFIDPSGSLKSMPYKARDRTSWRMWLQQVRGNNQHD